MLNEAKYHFCLIFAIDRLIVKLHDAITHCSFTAASLRHDWHPADIKAALEKRGKTLSSLATLAGTTGQALAHALRRPHATAERLIAAAIGEHPKVIWPSRYDSTGERKSPQPVDNYRAIHHQSSGREAVLSRVEAR